MEFYDVLNPLRDLAGAIKSNAAIKTLAMCKKQYSYVKF